jgi:hypothetical protein
MESISRVGLEITVMYCTVWVVLQYVHGEGQMSILTLTDVSKSWRSYCGPSSGSSRNGSYLDSGGSTRRADRSNDHTTKKEESFLRVNSFVNSNITKTKQAITG